MLLTCYSFAFVVVLEWQRMLTYSEQARSVYNPHTKSIKNTSIHTQVSNKHYGGVRIKLIMNAKWGHSRFLKHRQITPKIFAFVYTSRRYVNFITSDWVIVFVVTCFIAISISPIFIASLSKRIQNNYSTWI